MVATWSTDAVRGKEAFSYWRYVVREAVLNVGTEARSDAFSARISWRKVGDLRLSNFESSPHVLVRTQQHLSGAEADNYLISLQREGESHISQGGEDFVLSPGEIAIVNGHQPFLTRFPTPVSRIIAVVPRAALERRAPWISKSPVRKIDAKSPFVALIRSHLVQLTDFEANLNDAEATLLTENLCNLVALASAREVPTDQWAPTLQIEALLTFCRQNLTDCDLSPQTIAAHFGISVRTVHQRFSSFGTTFGRWLLDNRLVACRQTLLDPAQSKLKISEIAYCWGFNDLSHFNRLYRSKFGETPGDTRLASRC
jgi:AraC-like DNA-binding protein